MLRKKILIKKTVYCILFLYIGMTVVSWASGRKERVKVPHERISLTLYSWKPGDAYLIEQLARSYRQTGSNVEIIFQSVPENEYDTSVLVRLESGTAPDLIYARPYEQGRQLFNSGFLKSCTDIPGVMACFTDSNLRPWQVPDGNVFAVPLAAVSHGVYYNKTLFEKEHLAIPETWEGFLALCEQLQQKGFTPLANSASEDSLILERFFLPLLSCFTGGRAGREQYEKGEKALNDSRCVSAYQAMADVSEFCAPVSVSYHDGQNLFKSGQAAMIAGTSAEIEMYQDVAFDWGIFALPAPSGLQTVVCVQPETAIAINTASKYVDAACAFLAWLCSREGALVAAEYMPAGYFPTGNYPFSSSDQHINEFLQLSACRETDVRFIWPAMMDAYTVMQEAVIAVMKGAQTAQQAADTVCDAVNIKGAAR